MAYRPVLFILCGVSYSGKSTLAAQLAAYYRAEEVSYDVIYPDMKPTLPANLGKTAEWKEVQRVSRGRVKQLLSGGTSVIYDDLNIEAVDRQQILELARTSGVVGVTIFMNTPIEVIREREKAVALKNDRTPMEEDNFQFTLTKLEIPNQNESIWVSPDDSFQAIVERINDKYPN